MTTPTSKPAVKIDHIAAVNGSRTRIAENRIRLGKVTKTQVTVEIDGVAHRFSRKTGVEIGKTWMDERFDIPNLDSIE